MNVVVVVLAFWLPGLVFGAAIRLRGWTLAASAPVLTFGLVALGIPVLGALGIRWNLLDVVLWTLVLSALGFAGSWLFLRRSDKSDQSGKPDEPKLPLRDHLVIGGGVLIGLAVGAVTFLRGAKSIDNVHQSSDAPFHGNLVRWIAEHGDARPSTVGTIANLPNETHYFYPDTYHALLALILDKAGLAMPQLLNLAALTVILCVPVGIAALGVAWRLPPIATAAAAAVCTWFTAFPYDLLWRGPLWPYAAGVALIPAVLALARRLLEPRGIAGPVAISVGVAGLTGLHSSVVFVVVGYFLLILLAVVFRFEPINWRRSWPSLVATAVGSGVLAVLLILPSLYNAAGVTSASWPTSATVSGAVGETITFSPMAAVPLWWIGVPAIVGVFLLVKHRRMLWLVGAYVVFGGLFAAAVSIDTPLVHTLGSIFYNDQYRIGALIPLAGAVAFGEFVNTASGRIAAWRPNWRPATATLACALVLGLVLAALSKGGYIGRNAARFATSYTDGPTVSRQKEAAFEWLAEHTLPSEHVMNDFTDGSEWMYALDGVMPVEWNFYGADRGTEANLLTLRLNNIDQDPSVRKMLGDLKVRYVLVGKGLIAGKPSAAAGLANLDANPVFRVVYRNPDATIYAIDGQPDVVRPAAP
ncbi:MAG: Conserved putative rane protein [Amycolatopsis sp.]|uniref:DUF6541 family protein n=1 Tax=Amycolatopsis sp. TaxID=37632 RepID=UPI002625F4F7|nr:DUF6541 family protein [Amycolatopsis sp.]MCU1683671.1 Conserved putative rane protein [Amycolatopsis sp.]